MFIPKLDLGLNLGLRFSLASGLCAAGLYRLPAPQTETHESSDDHETFTFRKILSLQSLILLQQIISVTKLITRLEYPRVLIAANALILFCPRYVGLGIFKLLQGYYELMKGPLLDCAPGGSLAGQYLLYCVWVLQSFEVG